LVKTFVMKFLNLCFFFFHLSNIKSLKDIFSKYDIENFMCMGSVDGWDNETKFPNVSFLTQQKICILGSKIETKWIFSIASVLTRYNSVVLGLIILTSLSWFIKLAH
jgi:hypothetical protein